MCACACPLPSAAGPGAGRGNSSSTPELNALAQLLSTKLVAVDDGNACDKNATDTDIDFDPSGLATAGVTVSAALRSRSEAALVV